MFCSVLFISGNELVSFPLSLPSTYPDLSDLVSPDNTELIQPSPQQEEEEGVITIDPMSFVNLPDTSGTLENNS